MDIYISFHYFGTQWLKCVVYRYLSVACNKRCVKCTQPWYLMKHPLTALILGKLALLLFFDTRKGYVALATHGRVALILRMNCSDRMWCKVPMFQPIHHVSPTDGNGPTQGQRKTLTRVGFEPTTWVRREQVVGNEDLNGTAINM